MNVRLAFLAPVLALLLSAILVLAAHALTQMEDLLAIVPLVMHCLGTPAWDKIASP